MAKESPLIHNLLSYIYSAINFIQSESSQNENTHIEKHTFGNETRCRFRRSSRISEW